jgi:hypothetical protein
MRFTLFMFLFSVTFLTGCGSTNSNPFGAVYVEGMVTLDGIPIQGVNVNFIPREGNFTAGGLTDAAGKFTLAIGGSDPGTGAKPGTYDVIFSKMELADLPASVEESIQRGGGLPKPKHIVPQKYENPKLSGIDPVTVSNKKADNKFTFELKSQ